MIFNCLNIPHQTKQRRQLNTCYPKSININSSSLIDWKKYNQSPLESTSSNCQNKSHQTDRRQFDTICLHRSKNINLSSLLDSKIENTTSPCQSSLVSPKTKMSTITASVAATDTNKTPPMEAVVVNSIIYSKPSFCRISVDLGDVSVDRRSGTKKKLTNGSHPDSATCVAETICASSMDIKELSSIFDDASCSAGIPTTSSLDAGGDAKLYRMCTTLNGSIHHQISDLCGILAMAGFYGVANNEEDEDSFIQFAYGDSDDDDDEDDDSDKDDCIDDYEDDYDDDNDVVDFSYECPIEPVPKLNCDRKKKVRFNTNTTVHNMHTWSYAYRAARKGEWEMYARDRERFKLRIQRTALILNPILEREHRQKIYEKRFANVCREDEVLKKFSTNIESKNPHQKKKRKKRRYCKMGNKHYF